MVKDCDGIVIRRGVRVDMGDLVGAVQERERDGGEVVP